MELSSLRKPSEARSMDRVRERLATTPMRVIASTEIKHASKISKTLRYNQTRRDDAWGGEFSYPLALLARQEGSQKRKALVPNVEVEARCATAVYKDSLAG